MKKLGPPIKLKEGSDFWKIMQERRNIDPEKAAQQAAEAARKAALAEIAKREAEHKAFLDSLCFYENLEFKNQDLREQVEFCRRQYEKLQAQASFEWKKSEKILVELQEKCAHDLVIERRTTYTDEYDQWHDGHLERKCIECFLVEESSYCPSDRAFERGHHKYTKLLNSKVVLLRKTINDEQYEMEFDDLKW